MYLKEKFGGSELLIASKHVDEPIVLFNYNREETGGFNVELTGGISTKITELKEVVKDLVESLGENMSNLNTKLQSSSISLEFSITLSQGGWIIGLESEQAIKLKIDWKNSQ